MSDPVIGRSILFGEGIMKLVFRLLSVVGAVSAVAAANASFTVGTFADPAAGSSQNFFQLAVLPSGNDALLSASWLTDGLHLLTPGIPAPDQFNARLEVRDAQNNAQLQLTRINNESAFASEAGYVRFFDTANNTLLRIDFFSATLSGQGFSAGPASNGTNIDMSGSIVSPGWSDEYFGFTFANWLVAGSTATMSASFTSSAVPEPATMAVLGLGVAALARRRRK